MTGSKLHWQRRCLGAVTALIGSMAVLSCAGELEETPICLATPCYQLVAGFEEAPAPQTRSRFALSEDGASEHVVWSAGDAFKMFGGSYAAIYTTEQGGEIATFSASSPVGEPCYSIYPASRAVFGNVFDGERILAAAIPATQTAVAGGIADGINLSAAYSEHQSDDLRFSNLLSYIRFRLEGEAVSATESVIFDAGVTVAGDASIHQLETGNPVVDFEINWNPVTEPLSKRITLNGSFEAGKDYFIALAPVSLNGFNLILRDGQGRTIRRHATMPLKLERSRIYDFGTIDVGAAFPEDETGERVIRYMQASAGSKPVVLCVISEGFRSDSLETFQIRAEQAIDLLFQTEPYKSYRDRFTVNFLAVPSVDSGASVTDGNGTVIQQRNTRFGARWGQDQYGDMIADSDTVFAYVKAHCPEIADGTHTIQEVPILMVINDPRYGGICHSWSDGRAYAMIPYCTNGSPLYWKYPDITPSIHETLPTPITDYILRTYYHTTTAEERTALGTARGDWRNIAVHEFGGHAIARLTDEYWSSTQLDYTERFNPEHHWQVPFGLNVAASRDSILWQADLLSRLETLKRQDARYERVGIYQGGDKYIYGRWRAEMTGCMIDNRLYFSAWQRDLIVRRLLSLAGEPFDVEAFLAKDVTLDPVRDGSPSVSRNGLEHNRVQATLGGPLPPPVLHEVPAR